MFAKNRNGQHTRQHPSQPDQPSQREAAASLEGASMGAFSAQMLGLLRDVQSKAAEARFLDALELLAVTTYARTFLLYSNDEHTRVAHYCA